ncbi:MAG TPA: hypothetical protein VJH88_04170 [Candidatus Nanoarchaeia archaeon]|nr:hypothetical protein [Candidatus Nanoarchaeia archaeon]
MKSVALVMMVLLLVSCTRSTANDPIDINFKSGTSGIELQLLANHPPRRIVEGSTFNIAVQVSNTGAYDMGVGEITVIGLDQVYTPIERQDAVIPPLKGRSESNNQGDFYVQEFSGGKTVVPPGAKEYRAKFLLVAAYEYMNVVGKDVCINPALIEIESEQASCQIQDRIRLSGQGAPVAVTQIEETVSPVGDDVKIDFILTIDNRGRGKVVSPILISDVRLGTKPLTCNKREITMFELENKRNTVVCSRTEQRQSAYTSPLSATLQYMYKTTEEGEFVVQRSR